MVPDKRPRLRERKGFNSNRTSYCVGKAPDADCYGLSVADRQVEVPWTELTGELSIARDREIACVLTGEGEREVIDAVHGRPALHLHLVEREGERA